MLPGLIGAGVTQLNLAVDVIIASLLPAGTVSLLYYADRVQQLPLGVIGTAVGTALLPLLSRQVRAGEAEAARATLNRAIEYALFLTLPAAVALIVSAYPVMWVLFGRGAFDAESARLSAQSLAAYALGLPAFVLVKVLAPGFFARGDTATPVKIGVAAVALNLAMNVAFMVPLQHIGPALATSLAAIFNVGWLGVVLARRGHLRLDAQLRRRSVRMAAAAGGDGCGAVADAAGRCSPTPLHGVARMARWRRWLAWGWWPMARRRWHSAPAIGGRSAGCSGEGWPGGQAPEAEAALESVPPRTRPLLVNSRAYASVSVAISRWQHERNTKPRSGRSRPSHLRHSPRGGAPRRA